MTEPAKPEAPAVFPETFDPFDIDDVGDISSEHVRYFRAYPDQLVIISEREDFSVSKYGGIFVAAVLLVGTSKYLATTYSDQVEQLVNNVIVDLVFEMGAALIGSVATVLFINLHDKRQFQRNLRVRLALERRIAESAVEPAARE